MSYKVVLSPHAVREYKKLSPVVKTEIKEAIDSLAKNPVAGAKIKRLKGRLNRYYRYRAGDYRVVYSADQSRRMVFVDYVQHRKSVYRETE